MNVNIAEINPPESLADRIEEHHAVMSRQWTLTGEVALISDPDPTMRGTSAMQVWSKTAEGVWVWVSPEGEVTEAACPFRE